MIEPARSFRLASVLRLAAVVTLLCLGAIGVSATPLALMPGAPLLPVIVPPTQTIFNLTPVVGGVQTGSVIPAFGGFPGADFPLTGGVCGSFVTGEICPTLEPDAGFGVRDWETELANETGPAVENFVAGFFAPGLAVAYRISLPRGTGIFFDFRYIGPTLPLWGVFSFVPFPVTIATSIIDPLPDQLPIELFGEPGGSFALTTDAPDFGNQGGVPEPGSLILLGAGLMGIWYAGRRRRT